MCTENKDVMGRHTLTVELNCVELSCVELGCVECVVLCSVELLPSFLHLLPVLCEVCVLPGLPWAALMICNDLDSCDTVA